MIPVEKGGRIWFAGERIGYTVREVSADGRWAICTKPFAARGDVIYSALDFERGERGPIIFTHPQAVKITDDGGIQWTTDALERGDAKLISRCAESLQIRRYDAPRVTA